MVSLTAFLIHNTLSTISPTPTHVLCCILILYCESFYVIFAKARESLEVSNLQLSLYTHNILSTTPPPHTHTHTATSPSYAPSLRLVGGTISSLTNQPLSGRLEVNFDGVWGTIGSTGFDHLSAHVLCAQLGYATAIQVFNSSRYVILGGIKTIHFGAQQLLYMFV